MGLDGKTVAPKNDRAQSVNSSPENNPIPADLQALLAAWSKLPKATRDHITALVKQATRDDGHAGIVTPSRKGEPQKTPRRSEG